jgi:hypothetical protein
MMHGHEKSDSAVVAVKPPNKTGQPAAEAVERRAEAKENANQRSTRRTQSRESVTQALERVRKAARQRKKERFHRALPAHHNRPAAAVVSRSQAGCGTGCGRRDVAGL